MLQPFCWSVTEHEITLKVWEFSVPGVDTWRGWGLRRLFGHVRGTADVATVLENEKRMIADLVERVEGGHFAEQDVLPSRTSWNMKNLTQEVPYFVRGGYHIRTRGLLSFLCDMVVLCRSARSSKTRGLLQSVLGLCMTEDQLVRLALLSAPDEILAMCDRRGDAVRLHMSECVQQAFNDIADPTLAVLAMTFASAILNSSVTCGSCCAWNDHMMCSVARFLDHTAPVVFHSDPLKARDLWDGASAKTSSSACATRRLPHGRGWSRTCASIGARRF